MIVVEESIVTAKIPADLRRGSEIRCLGNPRSNSPHVRHECSSNKTASIRPTPDANIVVCSQELEVYRACVWYNYYLQTRRSSFVEVKRATDSQWRTL